MPRNRNLSGKEVNPVHRTAHFPRRAVQQYLACLAATGRLDTLEDYVQHFSSSDNKFSAMYYKALALALGQKIDDALEYLRELIGDHPKHKDARMLTYRLLVHKARVKARSQDWAGLSDVVSEALELFPPGEDIASELLTLSRVVPFGHLRSENREEAAKIWERELQQNPNDVQLIHNLALIHYWWARGISQNGSPPPMPQWRATIAYWVLLANLEPFWEGWKTARAKAWGFDFPAEELETFRNTILEEHLEYLFLVQADEYKQRNDSNTAQAFEECLTATILEKKSATCWRQALALLPPDKSRHPLLSLPGGVMFFQRFGLLSHIYRAVNTLAGMKNATDLAANLHIYFSKSSLGTAAILSEERNKPEEAIRLLDRLPQPSQDSVDACYVRVQALTREAASLSARGEVVPAVNKWKKAHEWASIAQAESTKPTLFEGMLGAARDSIRQETILAVQRGALRFKRGQKLDQAISLLESGMELDKEGALLEILCIYMCDRGYEKLGKKNLGGARNDFNHALKLKPGFQRAKQGLSTTYNNEACEQKNGDRAISLFEKAIEMDPASQTAKENLAGVLKGKAVDLVNDLNNYTVKSGIDKPIQLLERAARLVGQELKDDALTTIRSVAEVDVNRAQNMLNQLKNDLLKRILSDLITVYDIRRKTRGF